MPELHFKPVQKSFTAHGSDFTLMKREGDVALYRYFVGKTERGFELVIIRRQESKILKGKDGKPDHVFPAQEVYPSASQWGIFGWTYLPTQEKLALERFDKLVEAQKKKEEEISKAAIPKPLPKPPPKIEKTAPLPPAPAFRKRRK